MKPIEIRGHHLFMLRGYSHGGNRTPPSHDSYGKKFIRNESEIFNMILEGKTPIIVTDEFDDVCSVCNYRTKIGCLKIKEGKIFSVEEGAKTDKISARYLGVEINRIYESSELLREIGIMV